MKTLHILTVVIALFILPTFASANDSIAKRNEKTSIAVIAEKIQRTVHAPETLGTDEQNARVFVVFSIAENGTVNVLEVGTLDPAVKASITQQFETMAFDNTASNYDGQYSIWLNFKTL